MALSERLAYILDFDTAGAVKSLEKVGETAERELGKTEGKLDKVAGNLTKFGVGAMAFAGVAGAGLAKLGQGAADTAANFSALEQVVGEVSAHHFAEWAEDGAEKVGLAKGAIFDAATTFGMFGKEAGYAGAELNAFIEQQITLAADWAAFKNVSPEQVIQDVRAAYAGSSETLQKYIGTVNDAAIKEALLAETGEEVTGVLTGQQRIIGINTLMMEKGADMTGQWDRELGELEGQQAKAAAEMKNLADEIGEGVVPMMVALMGIASDVIGAVSGLNDALGGNLGQFAAFGVAGLATVGVMSSIVGQIIKMRTAFAALRTVMVGHPILTIATVAAGVASAIGLIAVSADDSAISVNNMADAMIAAESAADGLRETITAWVADDDELAGAMDVAGVTIEDLARAAEEGDYALERLAERMIEANRAAGEDAAVWAAFQEVTGNLDRDLLKLADSYVASVEAKAMHDRRHAETTSVEAAGEAFQSFERRVHDTTRAQIEAAEAARDLQHGAEEAGQAASDFERRVHDAARGTSAFAEAQRAGFDTVEEWQEAVATSAELMANIADEAEAFAGRFNSAFASLGSEIGSISDESKSSVSALAEELNTEASNIESYLGNIETAAKTMSEADIDDPAFLTWLGELGLEASDVLAEMAGDEAKLQTVYDSWKRATDAAGTDMADAIADYSPLISGALDDIPDALQPAVQRLKTSMGLQTQQVGAAMIDGVVVAIDSNSGRIGRSLRSAAESAVADAKAAMDIRSPSGVTRDEIGIPMAEGIEEGLREKAGDVAESMRELMRDVEEAGVKGAEDAVRAAERALGDLFGRIDDRFSRRDVLGDIAETEREIAEAERLRRGLPGARDQVLRTQREQARAEEALAAAQSGGGVAAAQARLDAARRGDGVSAAEAELRRLQSAGAGTVDIRNQLDVVAEARRLQEQQVEAATEALKKAQDAQKVSVDRARERVDKAKTDARTAERRFQDAIRAAEELPDLREGLERLNYRLFEQLAEAGELWDPATGSNDRAFQVGRAAGLTDQEIGNAVIRAQNIDRAQGDATRARNEAATISPFEQRQLEAIEGLRADLAAGVTGNTYDIAIQTLFFDDSIKRQIRSLIDEIERERKGAA